MHCAAAALLQCYHWAHLGSAHNLGRCRAAFCLRWRPKKHDESEVVRLLCRFGPRYISENFEGMALHPVDVLDASSGRLLCQMTDPNLSTICPVWKYHATIAVPLLQCFLGPAYQHPDAVAAA